MYKCQMSLDLQCGVNDAYMLGPIFSDSFSTFVKLQKSHSSHHGKK